MNMKNEILSIFQEALVDHEQIEVNSSTPLENMNFSSLEFIGIIVQVEELFNIEFEDTMLLPEAYRNIDDFIQYVSQRILSNT